MAVRLCIVLAAAFVLLRPAIAGITTWNVASGNWTTSTNWTFGLPSTGTSVEFHNGGTATLGLGPTVAIGSLNLGSGSLSLLDGHLVTTTATLGDVAGTLGQLTLTRQVGTSGWINSSQLILGSSGTGRVTVQSGAFTAGGPLTLGQKPGSRGDLLVVGGASIPASWSSQSTAQITIGFNGAGTVAIGSNATFSTFSAGLVTLGEELGGSGSLSVDGTNARWQAGSQSVRIGDAGLGIATVANRGSVLTGPVTLGNYSTGSGSLFVTGIGSTWQAGQLSIGVSGSGTVRVDNGGHLASGPTTIGGQPDSTAFGTGSAVLTGTGSLWTVASIDVNHGTLTVDDHASLQGGIALTGPDATLILGDGAQIQSFIQAVTGSHIEFINSGRYLFAGSIDGDVALEMRGRGTLVLAGLGGGPLTISTGTVLLDGTNAGTVDVKAAGTLGGTSGFFSHVTAAGTLTPGDPTGGSPVATLRASDMTWNSGLTYDWDLRDATAPDILGSPGWDRVWTDTTLQLATGGETRFTLRLATLGPDGTFGPADNFDPAHDYTWTIATAENTLTGFDPTRWTVDTNAFQNPAEGTFALVQTDHSLQLTYSAVPEPSVLSGIGLCAFFLLIRRRQGARKTFPAK